MTMNKRALLAAGIAALVVSVTGGCATTQGEPMAAPGASVMASGDRPLPQCVPGWNQCVCEKESRCCSVRQECSCTTGATPGLAHCG
ncbi:MAG TPA: hypothetical protein VLT89_04925 [Usitatibacter sp.]|nr:hypothetical protein [Usitatibacter sp.]